MKLYNIMFLLTLLKVIITFTIGFSKNPFVRKNYNYKQKFTIFIDKFRNIKKNSKIIEFPVDNSPEKWEEGEIPWDFVDTNVTFPKKYLSLRESDRIAFLFT